MSTSSTLLPDTLPSLLSQCLSSPCLVHLSRLDCKKQGSNTSAQCVCTRPHVQIHLLYDYGRQIYYTMHFSKTSSYQGGHVYVVN